MKYIGDVVLTTPLIRAVRERYPTAYLAYMGERGAVSLLEQNPFVDEIIAFDFSKPFEFLRVAWLLRLRKFDVVVDLYCNPRTALLSYLSGAPRRIGKEAKWRGRLYTERIRDDGRKKTAVEFHARYVAPLGVELQSWKTEIFLSENEKREARIYLQWQGVEPGRPLVALHVGASWPAKMWGSTKFAELARHCVDRLRAHVLVIASSKEQALARQVAAGSSRDVKIIAGLPLRQLAAVLSHCSVMVANDAGPLHIAVAAGIPTIGIFGPGEEDIWFPYISPFYESSPHVALRKDVPCHPCHLNLCNRTGEGYMECMTLLSVEEVFEQVRQRLVHEV